MNQTLEELTGLDLIPVWKMIMECKYCGKEVRKNVCKEFDDKKAPDEYLEHLRNFCSVVRARGGSPS